MDIYSKYQLPPSYYLNPDVIHLARDLIGKILFTQIDGQISAAIITETEAYAGVTDKASHAYGGRRTKRTETMFLKGGHAYIYLIYGIHHLFNVVTNKKEIPHAILIRGGYPILGMDQMIARNSNKELNELSLIGPGKLSKLMGILTSMDTILLQRNIDRNSIWIEDWGLSKELEKYIETSKRIGIDYAEEDTELPYRFFIPPKSEELTSILKQIRKPVDY